MDKVHQVSQASFTQNAVLYDKARPSYSQTAIERLIAGLGLQTGAKVLDLVCQARSSMMAWALTMAGMRHGQVYASFGWQGL